MRGACTNQGFSRHSCISYPPEYAAKTLTLGERSLRNDYQLGLRHVHPIQAMIGGEHIVA